MEAQQEGSRLQPRRETGAGMGKGMGFVVVRLGLGDGGDACE